MPCCQLLTDATGSCDELASGLARVAAPNWLVGLTLSYGIMSSFVLWQQMMG
jgi:hypothetical protein